MASKFCQDQLFTLGFLKSWQKKDQRVFQILQVTISVLNMHKLPIIEFEILKQTARGKKVVYF